MTGRTCNIRLDFIAHWAWTILYLLLALSGFSMMGSRFGWMFGYDFRAADFIHRVIGVVFIILVLLVVIYEIVGTVRGRTAINSWLPIGKWGFAGFTFLTTLLIIFSGFLIWFHTSIPYIFGTFGFIVHEFVTLLSIGSIVGHIYDKSYVLRDIS